MIFKNAEWVNRQKVTSIFYPSGKTEFLQGIKRLINPQLSRLKTYQCCYSAYFQYYFALCMKAHTIQEKFSFGKYFHFIGETWQQIQ